jgi:two-component system, OmpR family, sensor kinase
VRGTVSERKRRLSASGRVAVAMTFMLAIAIVALCAIAYVSTLRSLTNEVDRSLLHEAQAYAAAMKGSTDSTSLVDASRSYLQGRTGAVAGPDPILLVMTNGHVLSNSSVRLEAASDNRAATEPTVAPAGFASIHLAAETYRVLSAPIVASDGSRVGLLQTALSERTPQLVAASVAGSLAAAGLIVMLFGVALSIWAARASLSPLRRMAADAASITHASPGRRIAFNGPADELGSLADSLNAMLDRLERAYSDQRRFVADASHELRTPVAIVRGNVELLRSGKLSGTDALESIEMIEAESSRMTRLLDELLSLARLEGAMHEFQPLDVRTMLDEGAARARKLGDRVLTVTCASGAWISGDPDLLDQAIVNVLRNAVAHTRDGGHITLSCTATPSAVTLSVTDDGPGIPQADLDRIFDRFYRAQGPRPGDSGGAGLGLAIAKRLVDLHGGTMSANNVVPTGACFSITLPRIAPPPRRRGIVELDA